MKFERFETKAFFPVEASKGASQQGFGDCSHLLWSDCYRNIQYAVPWEGMGSGGVGIPRLEVALPALFTILGLAQLVLPDYEGLHLGNIRLISELVVLAFFAHGIHSVDASLVTKFFGWLLMLALISLALLFRPEGGDMEVLEWFVFLASAPWVILEATVVVRLALTLQPFALLGITQKRLAGEFSYISLTSNVRLLSWMVSLVLLGLWAAAQYGLWQLQHLEGDRFISHLARACTVFTVALTFLCLTRRLRLGILFPILLSGYELLLLSRQVSFQGQEACFFLSLAAMTCTAVVLRRRPSSPFLSLLPSSSCLSQRKADRWGKDWPKTGDIESQEAEEEAMLPAQAMRRRQRSWTESLVRSSCAAYLSTLLVCAGMPRLALLQQIAMGVQAVAVAIATIEALQRRDAFRRTYKQWFRRFYYQQQEMDDG